MSRKDFASLWQKAKRYFDQQDYQTNLKILEQLEKIGFSFELFEAKGLSLRMMGRFKEASRVYRKGQKEAQKRGLSEIADKFWRLRIEGLVSRYLEKKKYSQVLKILKSQPENLGSYYLLARVYLYLENLDLEIAQLDKIVSLEKNSKMRAMVCFRKGDVLKLKGDLEEAKQAYLKAIQIDASQAKSYSKLGNIYWSEGKQEKGFQMWKEAERLGYRDLSLFYNLAAGYLLLEKDWGECCQYIRKILDERPEEVEDLLIKLPLLAQEPLVYQLMIDEILKIKNQRVKEEFSRVLRAEKCNQEVIGDALVLRGLEEIKKIEKKGRKGKKIKSRDRRILEIIENGLKILEEVETKKKGEEKLGQQAREKLIKVLKLFLEQRKEKEEVYEKFLAQYQDFIPDLEEFGIYLEMAQEKGRPVSLILKTIEEVCQKFFREFEKRDLELRVEEIRLEETQVAGLRIIEQGGIDYTLGFIFNPASEKFYQELNLVEIVSHCLSQAKIWAKLPDYLTQGLIVQMPERFEFEKWLVSQKIKSLATDYQQAVIETIDRESLNLVADILKAHFQSFMMKQELAYLRREFDSWQEILTQAGALLPLKELPLLVRETVALETISTILTDEKLHQLGENFKELIEAAGYGKEIYSYYLSIANQIKLQPKRKEAAKKKKGLKIIEEEEF